MRILSADYEWLSLRSDHFITPNLQMNANITKNDTYDAAARKVRRAFDDAANKYAEDNPEQRNVSRLFSIQEDEVFYLNVPPASAKPMTIQGKDFTMDVKWNKFEATDYHNDPYDMDPSYSVIESKSPTAARKMYGILNNDPDALRRVHYRDLTKWLDKHKVAYHMWFSYYR